MDEARREPIVVEPDGGGRRSPEVVHVGNDVVFFEGNEEAMYVLADLGEHCNEHLLKPGAKYTIKGVDTDSPELWLDGVKFEGQYEDFIGTLLMMSGQKLEEDEQQEKHQQQQQTSEESQPREGEGEPDDTVKMNYSYKCHTQSRIKFHKKNTGAPATARRASKKVGQKEGEKEEGSCSESENSARENYSGSDGEAPERSVNDDAMEIDAPSDPRVERQEEKS
ncbi:hypothetical protein BSKO_10962 [Bryopsis sp. KO-2023]|nr:hypothetical protein BSKO_10962 [Bryopsis sp. KO-2023]